jgi:archaellum biogenesis ATPase FlaH
VSLKNELAQKARQRSTRTIDPKSESPKSSSSPATSTKPLASEAIVHRLSDVEPEQLEWLWPDRIPLGKLTLLAGDPGLGKSFVTCDISARISSGRAWPDDSSWNQAAGSVAMFNCEDGLRDTIRPRLDRAGADVSKIVAIEGVKVHDIDSGEARLRGFSLANDLPRLERVVADLADCRLIVIDPVSAYCGDADSHKNAEVRALLAPLAELAERFRVAVLMVTHLAKGTGAKAIYRSMGSLAFAAAARAVWHVAKDPDDEQRRLILPAKMNLAPDPTGLAYRIEQGAVCWEADPVKMHADELLAIEANAKPDTDRTQRDEAAEWLREVLADGPTPPKELIADGREHGHSEKTLRRAFKDIGGAPTKTGMDGGWLWSLPGSKPSAETESVQSLADLDTASLFPPLAAEDGHVPPKMPTP